MLSVSAAYRYYLYRHPADMRNGFDGLSGLVSREFLLNPLSGDVFIFFNRRKNRIKLLHWQGDGFALFYKRLEKGTYELPSVNPESSSAEIPAQQLLLMLEGISLLSIKKRLRYEGNFVNKLS